MSTSLKKTRLGPRLLSEARDPHFFNQTHVIFGGSGAVGGSTALQLINLFESVIDRTTPSSEGEPRVVITARTKQEIRQFTSTLFRIQQRDYGCHPTPLEGIGYRTVKGVLIELYNLAIDPTIPELMSFSVSSEAERRNKLYEFLTVNGLDFDSPMEKKINLLKSTIQKRLGHPFTKFLQSYRDRRGLPSGQTHFRSVVVGIPLASLVSYKLNNLETACSYLDIGSGSSYMNELKSDFLRNVCDDLGYVAEELADDVLAAHTTAVGGMYDEDAGKERTIRMGFSHSALDSHLVEKLAFAEQLTTLYTNRGIKMLITAAAIGIDSILVRKTLPLNPGIRRKVQDAIADGADVLSEPDLKAGVAWVYAPANLDLLSDDHKSISFKHGNPLLLDFVLKSGENGFFTVSNAEALYRVMRVTSNVELGLLLARTAILGDDPGCPSFVDNVCYYTETDNSRQVFDLIGQHQLRKNQVSGLQPKALQDLGSAKHQGELHTLGLLILLHRLQTLNFEAIPHHVDLKLFNPQEFFENNSQALTLDHVSGWNADSLSTALTTLACSTSESDLEAINHFHQADPNVHKAIHRVLRAVLGAVFAIPSLGTPILFQRDARRRVMAGYFGAPIDEILTHRDTFNRHLRHEFEKAGGGDEEVFERFVEFNIASYGFADIRPLAVLVTARSSEEALAGGVQVFRSETEFITAMGKLEPYTYFTTSGLLALLVRLKNLCRLAHQLDFKLGTSNEFRAHFSYDEKGRPLLIPGIVEAFRMVSEGLEKNTGLERLDGQWGYYADAGDCP